MVLLGVHCDEWDAGLARAKEAPIEYPIMNDVDSKTQTSYAIQGYPTVVVIDRKGIVRAIDPADLEATVIDLLAE